jgi:hypothetical protein
LFRVHVISRGYLSVRTLTSTSIIGGSGSVGLAVVGVAVGALVGLTGLPVREVGSGVVGLTVVGVVEGGLVGLTGLSVREVGFDVGFDVVGFGVGFDVGVGVCGRRWGEQRSRERMDSSMCAEQNKYDGVGAK